MEHPLPSALQFSHPQRYVKLEPGSVKHEYKAVIIGVCGFPEVSHFGPFSANFHYIANAGDVYKKCKDY